MDILSKHLNAIRVPNNYDNIYRDECVYSFDTPLSDTGIYVSLTSFLGFGKQYVDDYSRKSGNAVFLHIQAERKEIPQDFSVDGPEKKITRLAIGVDGGFDPDAGKKKYLIQEHYSIVVIPEYVTLPYPDDNLPMKIIQSVKSILSSDSALKKSEKEQLAGTWDGEVRRIAKHAENLVQLENGRKIPPTGWKCDKCDLENNLWLNLTDGSILCGRKYFDGTGGNDHAVQHFKDTGFPLAVKLGTITAEGKSDVYSYAEDDMVEDPELAKHLAHFGINITEMQKTDKSMIELELDLNQKIGEWALLTESSSKLEPISGPGYTGMKNLGNSCYLNSVMQVMFIIPDFVKRFVDKSNEVFSSYPADPANDFNIQMSKLGYGLLSGKYSQVAENSFDEGGIPPTMFKNLIGKNHPDFSTKNQQDAQEFFLHLVNVLDRNSRHQPNPADALKFSVEDRVECGASGKVKYTHRDEWCLPLPIPLSKATNLAEVKEYEQRLAEAESRGEKLEPESLVRARIPLSACIDKFIQSETVEQFYSTAINGKTIAYKRTRLATMPDFLLLHLKKFTLRDDWVSIKLDVAVEVPDILDLQCLHSTGKLAGEELLPEMSGDAVSFPPMDPLVLQQLIDMGFPPEACKRAIFFTKNSGIETATQWIMEHIADSDFGDPFLPPGTDQNKSTFIPDPNGLEMLMGMGFNEMQASKALKETDNNIERAADWIFSHQNEIDSLELGGFDTTPPPPQYRDGGSNYKLVAFISHMGTSSSCGHYVCHILKNNQWVIFNDSKVAISQNPPKDLGYLYLYQRV